MTDQKSIERRMAALFVVAMGLILWQAPRTHPLQAPDFVSALNPGDQVFPVAVPPEAPPQLPLDPAARLAFLKDHAVEGFTTFPAKACEGFVRMSAHHWLRSPVIPGSATPPRSLQGVHYLAAAGDPFAPIAADELLPAGPGPEVEVFCGS